MSNKQKKGNNPKVSSTKKESKVPQSISKSVNNKKDLVNKIERIGNFVSNELYKYDEENFEVNNILYLKGEQLVSKELEKDLDKNQINLNNLKTIIREIVTEEIEKKFSK